MYKIVMIIVGIIFIGCSSMQPQVNKAAQIKQLEEENFLIIAGLDAQNNKNFSKAIEIFSTLYEETGKKEYFFQVVKNLLQQKQYDKALAILQNAPKNLQQDIEAIRLEALTYFFKDDYKKSLEKILPIARKYQEQKDELLVAQIYEQLQEYDKAVVYYKKLYQKNQDQIYLLKIADIYKDNLHQPKQAIKVLNDHVELNGCSKEVCIKLVSLYGKEKNIDAVIEVLKKLYKAYPYNDEIAFRIVEFYTYQKNFAAIEKFLDENNIQNLYALTFYVKMKKYKKAAKVSQYLYNQTKKIDFLAQSAIYTFEGDKNLSKHDLLKVIEKLKKVVKEKPDAVYLNYLGYLLIDKDINIKEGIKYVKEALKQKPNSAYYLDSLAWGYYKLGGCYKAYKMFKKIVKLPQGSDAEVMHHYKIVKQCLRKRRKK